MTSAQRQYIAHMMKKLKLSEPIVFPWLSRELGRTITSLDDLDKIEASLLLEDLLEWETSDREFRRAMGQLDLL